MTNEDGRYEIPNLGAMPENVAVWGVNDGLFAREWSFVGHDLGLKDGSPLGTIAYLHIASGVETTVRVRFDYIHGVLEASIVGESQSDWKRLLIDARLRAAALMMGYAQIGQRAARSEKARLALLDAAGL